MEQQSSDGAVENSESRKKAGRGGRPDIITGLAELPSQTLLSEKALADSFGVTPRTVRRMVARFELPPPVTMGGRSTWISDRVLAHLEARAEKAAKKAEQEARRIESLLRKGPNRCEEAPQTF